MLILIEGPNGAGKSTLAEKLFAELGGVKGGAVPLHAGPPEHDPLTEYTLPLETYEPMGGQHLVCDRWHLGEEVYGPLLREGSRLGPAGFLYVELFLRSRGAVVVPLNPPLLTLLTRRCEEHTREELAAERTLFSNAFDRTRLPLAQADVLQEGASYEELAPALCYPGYVGDPLPEVLLVGDKPNTPPHCPAHRTPFVPYHGTSGHWLMTQLAPYSSLSWGLVNSKGATPWLRGLVQKLGGPKVIALGHEAHARLHACGIEHGAVAHPQYMRRFHHHHGKQYVKDILKFSHTKEHAFS